MKRCALWLLMLLLCLGASHVSAHDLGVAQLTLQAESDSTLLLRAKLSTKVEATEPQLPQACAIEDYVRRVTSPVTQLLEWHISCGQGLTGTIRLSWKREGALAMIRQPSGTESSRYLAGRNGDVDLNLDELFGKPRSVLQVAKDYLLLGIEHILLGFDHLSFVLALCLIASGWQLVKMITAFTLGHSMTLGLAFLGYVQLPAPPVEACIALSIAFVAREALRPEAERRHGFWLVAGFGLLHGLGFAGALSEIGISGPDLLLGLVAFNLGVEAGQLLFVAGVLALMQAGRSLALQRPWQAPAAAFGLGGLAMFWTLERLALLVVQPVLTV